MLSTRAHAGENVSQHAGEFESMAGESRGEDDLFAAWVSIQDEVFVRRAGVEAALVA